MAALWVVFVLPATCFCICVIFMPSWLSPATSAVTWKIRCAVSSCDWWLWLVQKTTKSDHDWSLSMFSLRNKSKVCLPSSDCFLLIFSRKLFPVNKKKHLDQNKFITGTLPTYWSQNEWLQCQLWLYRLIRVVAHNSASRLHYITVCIKISKYLFMCEIVKTINTSWWRDIQIRVTLQQMKLSWKNTRNLFPFSGLVRDRLNKD